MATFWITLANADDKNSLKLWLIEHKTASCERLDSLNYNVTICDELEESLYELAETIKAELRLV